MCCTIYILDPPVSSTKIIRSDRSRLKAWKGWAKGNSLLSSVYRLFPTFRTGASKGRIQQMRGRKLGDCWSRQRCVGADRGEFVLESINQCLFHPKNDHYLKPLHAATPTTPLCLLPSLIGGIVSGNLRKALKTQPREAWSETLVPKSCAVFRRLLYIFALRS